MSLATDPTLTPLAPPAGSNDETTRPRKAVILARGLGTRLRKAADAELTEEQQHVAATGMKAMMPVGEGGGRPFVEYVISALADAGLTDICLVIGPEHAAVREFFAARDMQRVTISFAEQVEPLGTANAVAAAREFVGDERFVMVNSDNFYPAPALDALVRAPGNATVGYDAVAMVERSNIPADRIAAFAILGSDEAGHLTELHEKPTPEVAARFGEHAMVSMNCFLFTPVIFEACQAIEMSARGEYEIVDAVRWLVENDHPVTVVPVAEGVLDMSGRADVAAVANALVGREVLL